MHLLLSVQFYLPREMSLFQHAAFSLPWHDVMSASVYPSRVTWFNGSCHTMNLFEKRDSTLNNVFCLVSYGWTLVDILWCEIVKKKKKLVAIYTPLAGGSLTADMSSIAHKEVAIYEGQEGSSDQSVMLFCVRTVHRRLWLTHSNPLQATERTHPASLRVKLCGAFAGHWMLLKKKKGRAHPMGGMLAPSCTVLALFI